MQKSGRRLSGFIFDVSNVKRALLDPEVLAVLKTFPQSVLDLFVQRLVEMLTSGDHNLAPRAENGPAGVALDGRGFFHIVWDGDVVTAALAAAKRHRDLLAVQEKASFRVGNSDAESYHESLPVNSN